MLFTAGSCMHTIMLPKLDLKLAKPMSYDLELHKHPSQCSSLLEQGNELSLFIQCCYPRTIIAATIAIAFDKDVRH